MTYGLGGKRAGALDLRVGKRAGALDLARRGTAETGGLADERGE